MVPEARGAPEVRAHGGLHAVKRNNNETEQSAPPTPTLHLLRERLAACAHAYCSF